MATVERTPAITAAAVTEEGSATGIDRNLLRQRDIDRLDHARRLAHHGMSKKLIVTLTGVLPSVAHRLLLAAGHAVKAGRRKESLSDVFGRASLGLEAATFAQLFLTFLPELQADDRSVNVTTLVRSFDVLQSITPQAELHLDQAYLIARDLTARKLQLVRCRADNTEFLMLTEDALVNGEYTRGECPWCRVRSRRSAGTRP